MDQSVKIDDVVVGIAYAFRPRRYGVDSEIRRGVVQKVEAVAVRSRGYGSKTRNVRHAFMEADDGSVTAVEAKLIVGPWDDWSAKHDAKAAAEVEAEDLWNEMVDVLVGMGSLGSPESRDDWSRRHAKTVRTAVRLTPDGPRAELQITLDPHQARRVIDRLSYASQMLEDGES